MIRALDKLGRLCIPKEILDNLEFGSDDKMEITYDKINKEIKLKRFTIAGECHFCGDDLAVNLLDFKGKCICKKCREEFIGE